MTSLAFYQMTAAQQQTMRDGLSAASSLNIPSAPQGPRFFAAFDGTGNSKFNPTPPNGVSEQQTSVSRLSDLVVADGIGIKYLGGVGAVMNQGEAPSGGIISGSGSVDRAVDMYNNLVVYVRETAQNNDGVFPGKLTVDVMGFSRGCGSARHFMNLVNELGIPGIGENPPLIQPGAARFSCLLIDSVVTSQESSLKLGIPASCDFALSLKSKDEMRSAFNFTSILPSEGFQGDPRLNEITLTGVHSDLGGAWLSQAALVSELVVQTYMVKRGLLPAVQLGSKTLEQLTTLDATWYRDVTGPGVALPESIPNNTRQVYGYMDGNPPIPNGEPNNPSWQNEFLSDARKQELELLYPLWTQPWFTSTDSPAVINATAPGVLADDNGNSTLNGSTGSDFLFAGQASVLNGGSGEDYLYGSGTSQLNGGDGLDTYIARAGDIISDSDRLGRIVISKDAADVKFTRDGTAVLITWTGPDGGTVRVNNWFVEDGQGTTPNLNVELRLGLRGATFTSFSAAAITQAALKVSGESATDTLSGLNGYRNYLLGNAGADWLGYTAANENAGSGNEVNPVGNAYDGGTGDDHIRGTTAADVYVFQLGDGHDTIHSNGGNDELRLTRLRDLPNGTQTEAIAEADVSFNRDGADLLVGAGVVGATGTADQVRVAGWFDGTGQNVLGSVTLGTKVWTAADINSAVLDPYFDNLVLRYSGPAFLEHQAFPDGSWYQFSGDGHGFFERKVSDVDRDLADTHVYPNTSTGVWLTSHTGATSWHYEGVSGVRETGYRNSDGSSGKTTNCGYFGQGYSGPGYFTSQDVDVAGNISETTSWVGTEEVPGSTYTNKRNIDGTFSSTWSTTDGTVGSSITTSAHDTTSSETYANGGVRATSLNHDGHSTSHVTDGSGNTTDTHNFPVESWVTQIVRGVPKLVLVTHWGTVEEATYANGSTKKTTTAVDGTVTVTGVNADQSSYTRTTYTDGTTFEKDTAASGGWTTTSSGPVAQALAFNRGDGQCVLTELKSSGNAADRLSFGVGISAEDVSASRDGLNLVLKLNGGTDQLTLTNFYGNSQQNQPSVTAFVSGISWTALDLATRGLTVVGTDGSETFHGIDGYTNTFTGGKGSDNLFGGNDADTYLFNVSDGQDVISEATSSSAIDKLEFGAGVLPSAVTVSRDGLNLVLGLPNADRVTVAGWYNNPTGLGPQIEQVKFADGTTWTSADLTARGLAVIGTVYNDSLYALDGFNNVLNSAGGNDNLFAYNGNDTLIGGSGEDMIYVAGTGTKTVDGGTGVRDQLVFSTAPGTPWPGESMSFANNQVSGTGYHVMFTGIEGLKFGDGNYSVDVDLATCPTISILYMGVGLNQVSLRNGQMSTIGGASLIDSFVLENVIGINTTGSTVGGGQGNDVYHIKGLTQLSLSDSGGSDKLVFDDAASIGDLAYEILTTGTYRISVTTGAQISLNAGNSVETVQLANGTALAWSAFVAQATRLTDGVAQVHGTVVNDTMTSPPSWASQLFGDAGDDSLTGGSLADTLLGGAGNDQLLGGAGNDTYKYFAGDGYDNITDTAGSDTVDFGAIAIASANLYRVGDDLEVTFGSGQGVLVKDQFAAGGAAEFLLFGGQSYSASQITGLAGTRP